MKKKNWLLAIVFSVPLTLALGFSNSASAAYTGSDCDEVTLEVNNNIDGQDGDNCVAWETVVNDEGANGVVNDMNEDGTADDPLFGGTEAWMELPLWNDGGVAGSYGCIFNTEFICVNEGAGLLQGGWSINTIVFDMYEEVMLFFKDGQHGATAVLLSPDGYSDVGGYVTNNYGAGVQTGACAWFGGATCYFGDFAYMIPADSLGAGAISHVNLWVRGRTDVAEPGTLALLGIGLLGLGLSRRRKNL